MLRIAAAGFRLAGYTVATLLDSRIAALNPPLEADAVTSVSLADEVDGAVKAAAGNVDAALVIAPEANGMLQSLVESVQEAGAVSLNCESRVIGEASYKPALWGRGKRLGLAVPETLLLDAQDDTELVKRMVQNTFGFPFVVKPVVGEDCGGLMLVKDERQLAAALERIRREWPAWRFMAQKYVDGMAASVSVLSTGREALPVSLNWQDTALGPPESDSTYGGGFVPFDSPLKAEAFDAAKRLVESYRGLRGYVGVDMVLTQDKPVVIEVNPRLTVSAVGLASVAGFNLAQAIFDAAANGELPAEPRTHGCSCFSKVQIPTQAPDAFREICRMDTVVSPPFPLQQGGNSCALLEAHDDTLEEARSKLEAARQRLRYINRGGGA